ncbi:MAG: metallophosphoesterase family protein [Planctomycetota bacterium]
MIQVNSIATQRINMLAVISDIHANRNALSVVLQNLLEMDPDQIICLGDIVGYGPDPKWCIDAVRSTCDVVLCGNHDSALIYGSDTFSSTASSAIKYHRQLLMPRPEDDEQSGARQRWNFLKSLPHRHAQNGQLFVHGSPRDPVREYLRPSDAKMDHHEKLQDNFDLIDHIAFVGHTHRPGIFTDDFEFHYPQDMDESFTCPDDHKAIINVGSIGQPRDGDVRASCITVDDHTVTFHRFEYDNEEEARRIEQSGLGLKLAERLRTGQ